MRSPHSFIVSPSEGKLYRNTRKVGNKEFVLSSSMENAKMVNREAVVNAIPSSYDGLIQDGAVAIVHHNVFRKTYASGGGKETFSSDMVDENNYLVPGESIYAYKNNGDELWSTVGPWCFIRPTGEMLHGEIAIGNTHLKKMEVFEGDQVVFIPDSEYEFTVDEEKLYRMYDHQITIKL